MSKALPVTALFLTAILIGNHRNEVNNLLHKCEIYFAFPWHPGNKVL